MPAMSQKGRRASSGTGSASRGDSTTRRNGMEGSLTPPPKRVRRKDRRDQIEMGDLAMDMDLEEGRDIATGPSKSEIAAADTSERATKRSRKSGSEAASTAGVAATAPTSATAVASPTATTATTASTAEAAVTAPTSATAVASPAATTKPAAASPTATMPMTTTEPAAALSTVTKATVTVTTDAASPTATPPAVGTTRAAAAVAPSAYGEGGRHSMVATDIGSAPCAKSLVRGVSPSKLWRIRGRKPSAVPMMGSVVSPSRLRRDDGSPDDPPNGVGGGAKSSTAPESCHSVIRVVKNLALKGLLLLVIVLGVWAIWSATTWTAPTLRRFCVGHQQGVGEGVSRQAIAQSLVRETDQFASLKAVVESRQRLIEDAWKTEEALSGNVQSLREAADTLGRNMKFLREQDTLARNMKFLREQLAEVETMMCTLKEAHQGTSENIDAGQEWVEGAEHDSQKLLQSHKWQAGEEVSTARETEVEPLLTSAYLEEGVAATVDEIKQIVAREVEIFVPCELDVRDYASLSAGASVVQGKDLASPAMIPVNQGWGGYAAKLFGMRRDSSRGTAEEAISASTIPGHCFAFRGGNGKLTVRLGDDSTGFVRVTHISIEHTSVAVLPSAARSAPRLFRVLGWDSDPAASSASLRRHVLVGPAEFSVEPDAPAVQTFRTLPDAGLSSPPPVGWATLEVESNHGGAWTCLYGFRVHGEPVP